MKFSSVVMLFVVVAVVQGRLFGLFENMVTSKTEHLKNKYNSFKQNVNDKTNMISNPTDHIRNRFNQARNNLNNKVNSFQNPADKINEHVNQAKQSVFKRAFSSFF